MTVDIGSPDVSQNSRQSEVPTQAGSPGIDGSTDLLTVPVGSSDVGYLEWTLTSREQCFLHMSEVPGSASELPT